MKVELERVKRVETELSEEQVPRWWMMSMMMTTMMMSMMMMITVQVVVSEESGVTDENLRGAKVKIPLKIPVSLLLKSILN